MTKSFTLYDLVTKSYEEIEAEGLKYGILREFKRISPENQMISTLKRYSRAIASFNSKSIGNFNLIVN